MTAMTVTTTRISSDEFLAGDYPIGSELIDGVVHVNDPAFLHQRICKRVQLALDRWAEAGGGTGEAGWGGNWVLSDGHVYKPDVWWAAVPPDGVRHDGPPDLAVEVRSPKTWHLDIGAKRREYRRSGTKELWLIDTPARTVFVYRAGESLDDALELGPGEQLTSPLLPGFTLAIDDLFSGAPPGV
jgi:Uma2 family endonuclease